MLALSILQPYAWLICDGHKDIENRSWATKYRGRFLIHAGKRYSRAQHEFDTRLYAQEYGIQLPSFAMLKVGGVVGAATLTDCVREHDSQWKHPDAYGYVLVEAQHLPFVPVRGQLKFFDVEINHPVSA